MMNDSKRQNRFTLDPLEPRILLSADPIAEGLAGIASPVSSSLLNAVENIQVDEDQVGSFSAQENSLSYHANADFDSLDALPPVDLLELVDDQEETRHVLPDPVDELAEDSQDFLETLDTGLLPSQTNVEASTDSRSSTEDSASPVTNSHPEILDLGAEVSGLDLTATSHDSHGDMAAELTNLQLAANPPPQETADFSTNSDNFSNVNDSNLSSDPLKLGLEDGSDNSVSSSEDEFSTSSVQLTPNNPLSAPDGLTLDISNTLTGNGTIIGDVTSHGTISPGDSPGILNITGDLTLGALDTLVIEIGGLNPGPSSDADGTLPVEPVGGSSDDGFDQINVTSGNVQLDGILQLSLINNFEPTVGDTFDIITFDGSLSGAFDTATGLFGFGDGTLAFDVEVLSDRVQLVVEETPAGSNLLSSTSGVNDALGLFYSDYFSLASGLSVTGDLTIDNFVNLQGTFDFGVSVETVTVATGLPANAVALFDEFDTTIFDVDMFTLTIGAADVHAFIGLNAPYWEGDADGDGNIDNEAVGEDLDGDTLTGEDEVNDDAVGLLLNDLDIGFTVMKPDPSDLDAANLLSFHPKSLFYALKATADSVEFVGLDDIVLSVEEIVVNVNNGIEWPGGFGPPVVDFEASYPGTGFQITTGGDPVSIDFNGNQRIGASATEVLLQLDQFVHIQGSVAFEKGPTHIVDIATGLPANLGQAVQTLIDAVGGLIPASVVNNTDLSDTALQTLQDAGLIDPGLTIPDLTAAQINTAITNWINGGGLYIETNLSTIHNLEVDSLQMGVLDVHAFLGLQGPYWTDVDGNGEISWSTPDGLTTLTAGDTPVDVNGILYGDVDGDGEIDANETAELNEDAIGVVIDDVDLGFLLSEPTLNAFPGFDKILPKFYAVEASANLAAVVGLEGFVEASLENVIVEVNNSGGWPGGLGPPVINFADTFATDEVLLFFDHDDSGEITVGDLRVIGPTVVAGLYDATTDADLVISFDDLVSALDANGNGKLEVDEVTDFGDASTADGDGDGKLDLPGFEVTTGTDTAPIYIDLDGNQRIGAAADEVLLQVDEFVHVQGSFSFEKGPTHIVEVATGLPTNLGSAVQTLVDAVLTIVPDIISDLNEISDAALQELFDAGLINTVDRAMLDTGIVNTAITTWKDDGNVYITSDLSTIHNLEVDSLQVGALNVHAFVGLNGPYWRDVDGDGDISWALPDGGVFVNNETIDGVNYNAGDSTNGITLTDPVTGDYLLGIDQTVDVTIVDLLGNNVELEFGDKNNDGVVDAGETAELDVDAAGLIVDNVDFGLLLSEPTLNALPGFSSILPKFYAIKASADFAAIVGLEELLQASITNVIVEVNNSGGWPGGLGPPVINFENTFATNELTDVFDPEGDGITVGELIALNGVTAIAGLYDTNTDIGTVVTIDQIVTALDTIGTAQETRGNGILELAEAKLLAAASDVDDADADEDGKLDLPGFEVRTGTTTAPVYLDYDGNQRIGAAADEVFLEIDGFVHVMGSFSFEKGPTHIVEVATGLPANLGSAVQTLIDAIVTIIPDVIDTLDDISDSALQDLFDQGLITTIDRTQLDVATVQSAIDTWIANGNVYITTDLSTIHNLEVDSLQIGALDVHAFVGLNGPYWTDLDGDDKISWALPDGGTFVNDETIGGVNYNAGDSTTGVSLTDPITGDYLLGMNETVAVSFDFLGTIIEEEFGNINNDEVVDANETAELNEDALGVIVDNVDFGFLLSEPTLNGLPGFSSILPKFYALKGTADVAKAVGVEDIFQASLENILIEVNNSTGWPGGLGPPVINFANTFNIDELNNLFDAEGDGITVQELIDLNGVTSIDGLYDTNTDTTTVVTIDEIITALDNASADPDTQSNGILEVAEAAVLAGATAANTEDADGDGQIEPPGFEVRTGTSTAPVYLDFDGNQRIGGAVDLATLQIAEFVHVLGAFSFEKGPTHKVEIATGLPSDLAAIAVDILDGLLGLVPDLINDIGDITDAAIDSLIDGGFLVPAIPDSPTVDEINSAITAWQNAGNLYISSDLSTIFNVEVDSFQIGAFNVHAFAGVNGPYWTDLNGDGDFSWTTPDGTTLGPDDTPVTVDDVVYGDVDDDDEIDANETAELNDGAIGLVVDSLDFGFLMSAPTLSSLPGLGKILPKFTAMTATAELVELVGLDDIVASLEGIQVNLNNGTSWPGNLGPPVINFENSFPINEILNLFDTNENGVITVGELKGLNNVTALDGLYDANTADDTVVSVEDLVAALDDPTNGGDGDEILDLDEAATLTATLAEVVAEDADGDDKLDLDGFEVRTGVTTPPVYINFDGNQRIGGSVEEVTIMISEFVHIRGSIAFEQGPVQTVAVGGGLLTELTQDAANALLADLGFPDDTQIPILDAVEKELAFMTIGAANVHAFIGMDGPYWIDDLDGDGNLDNEEPGEDLDGDGVFGEDEVNDDAVGVVVDDFDFGLSIMKPTNPLDFGRYFALKASAKSIALRGIEGVIAEATELLVEVNQSTPALFGVPLFQVVDFANTPQFASEELVLFDDDGDGVLQVSDLLAQPNTGGVDLSALDDLAGTTEVDHDLLVEILNTNDTGDSEGVIDINEANALKGDLDDTLAADADGDGKIDPLGFEVDTGSVPVYLSMDSALIRAQGFVELDIFGVVTLIGSVAFELGPTETVTIVNPDGTTSTDTVSTMTIGAANVFAFVGWDGPYFLDGNNNNQIDVDEFNNPLPGEVSTSAKGLALSELNVGIFLGLSTDLVDPAVYFAMNFSVDSIGIVGLDFLSADATLGLRLNLGASLDSGAVIDFSTSFQQDLNDDGDFDDENEMGFLVNTGDPEAPVLLDFTDFLINIELGGTLTISSGGSPIVELIGIFFLEIDGSSFKLFAQAAILAGPDIGGSTDDAILDISALGVVIINSDGFAADFDVDLDVNLPGLALTVSARVIINTTGEEQELEIPTRLLEFLENSSSLLAPKVLARLETCSSGSGQCYTISKFAPDITEVATVENLLSGTGPITFTGSTSYVVAVVSGTFNFVDFASGEGTVGVSVSPTLFQLYAKLQFNIGVSGIDLDFEITGVLEVSSAGLFLDVTVALDVDLTSLLTLDVSGNLLIDTTGSNDLFRLTMDGDLTIARVLTVSGMFNIEVGFGGPNTWRLDLNLSGDLGPIELTANGFIQSDGQFSLTVGGSLEFGIDGFKIKGGVTGTVSLIKSGTNYVFSPSDTYTLTVEVSGDVTLTIIGIDISVSATLGGSAVFSDDGTVLTLHAEGCVDLWLDEVCAGGDIAQIAIPASIFPEDPPNLATIVNTDQLRLNVGSNSGSRNVATSTTAEFYQLTDLGNGRVRVEAFGYTEIYSGVSTVTASFGSDNDTLILTDGFNIPVTANGNAGNDILTTAGLAAVVFNGGDNDDLLVGGPAVDTLTGGNGNDYLDGGGSGDILTGGNNDDVVFGIINDLLGDTATGGSGTDTIEVRGTNNADAFTLSEANGSLQVTVAGIGTITADEFENVTVAPGNDADTVNIVGNLSPSGIQNFVVSLGEDEADADIVDATLLSSADTLTITGDIAPSIRTNQRFASTVVSTAPVDNVPTSTSTWVQGHNSVISATDSSDQVLIDSLGGGDNIVIPSLIANTQVNTNTGADRIAVGSNATTTTNTGGTVDTIGKIAEGVVANLEIIGEDNSDALSIDDSADGDNETGNLTATRLTGLGMNGMIDYSEIETLNIDLGSGLDTFTIESTHSGATNLNANNGADIVNIRTVAGATTVNTGLGDDTINVGSNAQGDTNDPDDNTNGTLNSISSLLVVVAGEGVSDDDLLTVDDTADSEDNTGVLTSSRITGLGMGNADQSVVESALGIDYTEFEELIISLGAGADTFTINSTHNGTTELNGEAGADTVNVNGTSASSSTTINGNSGNDIINVRAMNGPVTVNGNANNDTVNVGSDTPVLPSLPTTQEGTIDDINALLVVDGGNGSQDVLNVDDSDPANNAKTGTLTSSTIRDLDLEEGINYTTFEELTVWLAFGNNTLTINSTHSGETTVNAAAGNDTIHINDASGILTVNSEADNDLVNVRATSLNSQTFINGADGLDTINLSDSSPTLPADFPASLPPPAADTVGSIDGIDGLIDIDGGGDDDVVNIDDSANTAAKRGTLTKNSLRGLDLPAGVNYTNLEDLNLWLGTGEDVLFIDSTHTGTTQVYAGDGNATVNERDDTIAINSISAVTTIHGQAGNDFIEVNVTAPVLPEDSTFPSLDPIVGFFERTHLNGIGAELNVHGEGNSDQVTVNFAGEGEALVNVRDNGAPDNGVDTLIINGADVVGGVTNQPDDTFLLRRDFVVLLNDSDNDQVFDQVERVNYDENINARLVVNGLGGEDNFVADDNSSITTLDGGDDNDTFQIGQVFGSPRDANANIAAGDTFDTTPVIIGVIRDPLTNAIIFNPAEDDLDDDAIAAIEQAIIDAGSDPLDGVAYLSDGVSHATTIFGGDGEDMFSIYHNKAPLRLEGEDGNDEFIVRAFVVLTGTEQAGTEVNGGSGNDLIQYAINAPVNIDGGEGFDTVVVLGTPFPDDFVVRNDGIFGAGLNVKFVNVESAELDTLEGDDTVYVLSTSAELVTTVIGGLGSDSVNVLGDVITTIVSSDLVGSSGAITHDITSADLDFSDAGVDGINTNVVSAENGALVNVSATGDNLLVSEDGLTASYTVSLTSPLTADFATVYLTVSAGLASTKDRSQDGESILVSTDANGSFTNAVVLTFTQANAKQTVYVQAIDDVGLEGERVALVSHSINSDSPSYDDVAIIDVFVTVVDNDQPGLDIRQFEDVNGTLIADNITEVLEGTGGLTDIYEFALTTAPDGGETVTVTLTHDDEITLSQTVFTFDSSDWDSFRTVIITAVDDIVQDGTEISTITHEITTDGAVFTIQPEDYPTLDVTVLDDETAGVIVRESNGSTVVVDGGDDDSYRLRLTAEPSAEVTLTLLTDQQTKLFANDSRFTIISEDASLLTFEYELTFDATNWSEWFEVEVSANSDFAGASSSVKTFSPTSQNLDKIAGPLVIEGGLIERSDRSLVEALVLPGELNEASGQENPITDESSELDILNIFHADNTDADSGEFLLRDGTTGIENTGDALIGFEMGTDLTIDEGTEAAPSLVTYGGGITYNSFEIVELLLGKGDESLAISSTLDDAITAVHGGGGGDTVTVTDRGEGPLVIYGDTSEDGVRYSNDSGTASEHATSFTNNGNDTIDASGLSAEGDAYVGVVIYGGPGDDIITGSQDDDHLGGGAGGDTISGEAGNDHIYGDSSFNVNLTLFAEDRITPFDETVPDELADINAMFTVPTTEASGEDIIDGDDGDDIVVSDHGIITQTTGTRRIQSTGNVEQIETTNIAEGAMDTVRGNAGNDIIFGGPEGDTIYGGNGVGNAAITDDDLDVLVGDNGLISDMDPTTTGPLSQFGIVQTTDTVETTGGDDTIEGNEDDDIILGGVGGDAIDGNEGNDVIVGDNGEVVTVVYSGQLASIDEIVSEIITGPAVLGGGDTIHGNDGADIILGGADDDQLFGDNTGDIILGDNAQLLDIQYGSLTVATLVTTETVESTGGNDSIQGDEGDDILVGGVQSDTITGNSGDDIVLGDNATLTELDYDDTGLVSINEIISSTDALGADDTIFGNEGDDALIGGTGNDTIDGNENDDLILGDNGTLTIRVPISNTTDTRFRVLEGDVIYSEDGEPLVDLGQQFNNPNGNPIWSIWEITVNPVLTANTFGDDIIAGGADNDTIFGQRGDDIIQGDGSVFIDVAESITANNGVVDFAGSVEDFSGVDTDGDDYIEGNSGADLIFGNLGQDDIIGGSSNLFGLDTVNLRADGSNTIFGGAGTQTRTSRNDNGDLRAEGHARDADTLLGDNGNIFRLVGTNGTDNGGFLQFTYDNYSTLMTIIPRAFQLLDYTLGGDASDIGTDDFVHGEAGDDVIHGMTGNDILFGEGQDDDIFGGTGHDRIFGGAGIDGVLGDDGKIITSRNGETETLLGLTVAVAQGEVNLPGDEVGAVVNITGRLQKEADLAAFDSGGNDIIYGGIGDDFLHGGAGDDAISGAEALPEFYNSDPRTDFDPLGHDPNNEGKFADFNADNPWLKIDGFFLNFEATDALGNKIDDGKDRIFGDLDNDWLVGGTKNDRLFGGRGEDLLNADDNLETNNGLNDGPDDAEFAGADFAYGGADRDVFIANTGADRLIDWVGEFNSYFVPFGQFGEPTVSRDRNPQNLAFVEELGIASGADSSLSEPDGELGVVPNGQAGPPRDPQPGTISGVQIDTEGGPEDDTDGSQINVAPVAVDDDFSTIQDTPIIINPIFNDIDENGDVLTLTNVSSPTFGTVVENPDSTITFDPQGTTGTAIFTYQTNDGFSDSNVATVSIDVGFRFDSTDTPVNIPDDGILSSTIDVIETFNIGDVNVELDITHTRTADLDVFLVSEQGTRIELFSDIGGAEDNFTNTILDDDAVAPIASAFAPFTGIFHPLGDLNSLTGETVTGTWTLEITDDSADGVGTLNNWSLIVEFA